MTQTTPDPRRWRALGVLALVQFILVLDVTVVNVALPHIQTDLHFSRAGLAWVVDGYVLTAGGLLLLGGKLADLFGRRRMFVAGLLLFVAASALSGSSPDSGVLVASRFLQGSGEAMAAPAAFGLIALLFTDPDERAKAIGIFGGVAGLGGTLGPVISGVLISVATWRWIFFVNVPIGIVAVLAVARLTDESRADRHPDAPRPDFEGAFLGTAALVAVVYGFISAGDHSWGSASVVAPMAAGAAFFLAFLVRERYAPDPLVPEGFLRNGTRISSNLTTLVFASVFFTLFFLVTLYLQQVEHYSAIKTGLAYLPFGLFIGAGIGIASTFMTRVGMKPLLVTGTTLLAVGVLLMSRITVHGSYLTQILPAFVVIALGSGFCFATFGNASMHEVSGQDASLASGVQQTAQQVGGAVGLAVLATMALRHTNSAIAHGQSFAVASTHGAVLALRIAAAIGAAVALLIGFAPIAKPDRQTASAPDEQPFPGLAPEATGG